MAYNPFDFFRKNQKILFAVLTVFIMIMFTLSTGAANDFFQWFPKWLGTRASGDVMAVVDGSKVSASELDQIQKQRQLAEQYMAMNRFLATNKMTEVITEAAKTAPEATKKLFERFLGSRAGTDLGQLRLPPFVDLGTVFADRELGQALFGGPSRLPREEAELRLADLQTQGIAEFRKGLIGIRTAPNTSSADQNAAACALKLLELDTTLTTDGTHFGRVPNKDRKDALDFLLWRMKADQLGIRLTQDDTVALVETEFLPDGVLRFKPEDRETALTQVTAQTRLAPAAVYGYVADEFRVRAAQQAVLGTSFIRAGGSAAVGPDQGYDRFKDMTVPVQWSVAVVRVSAERMEKVPGGPSPQEVQDIFKRGQNVEPDPSLSRPAFKKPREVTVGWLEITGKEAYYTAAAAAAMKNLEPSVNAAQWLVAPVFGGPLAQVAGFAVAELPDKALESEYERWKAAEARLAAFGSVDGKPPERTAAALARPEYAAMAVGLAAAAPLTAPGALELLAERADAANRIAARLPAVAPGLFGVDGFGQAALLKLVASNEYPTVVAPKSPPLAAVRGFIADRVRDSFQMRGLPRGDLEKLAEDTRKAYADNPDDANKGRDAAKAVVDAFIAARKLGDLKQIGGSAALADVFGIGKDPGLEPLKKKFDGPRPVAGIRPDAFGLGIFRDDAAGLPGRPKAAASQLFVPRAYPEREFDDLNLTANSQHVLWLTDDRPTVTPANPQAVSDLITKAWRRQKARVEAKKVADQLAKTAAGLKPDQATLASEWMAAAKAAGAEVLPAFDFGADQVVPDPQKPNGYILQSSPWPWVDIPYPARQFAQDLAVNRTKPLGTTIANTDQPEGAYYVAVLVGRTADVPASYATSVYAPGPVAATSPPARRLPRAITSLANRAAYEDALELLRSEYGYKDENPKIREKQ